MKKVFYLVAVATLAFFSCQKETNLSPQSADNNKLTFKASIEQLEDATKGTINASNGLVWAENDMIGIYFPAWGDKNQPFRLNAADAGNTEGNFTIATAADPSGASATAAYFPWWDTENLTATYPSSSQTNVFDGIVYFKMKSEYYGYSDGRMLTPLVAPITSSSDKIAFKHAGAAVKVTINNLVSGTYHTTMSVTGKQIAGDFHVNPANAGTDALALDGAEDASKNSVTLHAWKSSGAFTWIFPVPELTKPKLQFEVKDNNGVTVWSKKLKAQANDLGRGDILIMPELNIKPYEKFEQKDTWSFYCTLDGGDWQDINMMTDGEYCIISGITFKNGDSFKIHNKDWSVEYPAGYGNNWNFNSTNAGTKDVIFRISDGNISVLDPSFPYPTVVIPTASVSINIDGDMSDWGAVKSGVVNGSNNYREFKATYDKDNIYLYSKRVTVSGQRYMYYNFDLDNDSTNGVTKEGSPGLEAYMALVLYSGDSINLNPGADASYPDASVYAGVVCKGTVGTEFTETELSIPRTNLNIKNGDIIKIYSSGNKSASAFNSTPVTLTINN